LTDMEWHCDKCVGGWFRSVDVGGQWLAAHLGDRFTVDHSPQEEGTGGNRGRGIVGDDNSMRWAAILDVHRR
jgi:hypothetical protein